MNAVVVAVLALAAVLVLEWGGLREPRRSTPADSERVSKRWLDESRRSRDDDD